MPSPLRHVVARAILNSVLGKGEECVSETWSAAQISTGVAPFRRAFRGTRAHANFIEMQSVASDVVFLLGNVVIHLQARHSHETPARREPPSMAMTLWNACWPIRNPQHHRDMRRIPDSSTNGPFLCVSLRRVKSLLWGRGALLPLQPARAHGSIVSHAYVSGFKLGSR